MPSPSTWPRASLPVIVLRDSSETAQGGDRAHDIGGFARAGSGRRSAQEMLDEGPEFAEQGQLGRKRTAQRFGWLPVDVGAVGAPPDQEVVAPAIGEAGDSPG